MRRECSSKEIYVVRFDTRGEACQTCARGVSHNLGELLCLACHGKYVNTGYHYPSGRIRGICEGLVELRRKRDVPSIKSHIWLRFEEELPVWPQGLCSLLESIAKALVQASLHPMRKTDCHTARGSYTRQAIRGYVRFLRVEIWQKWNRRVYRNLTICFYSIEVQEGTNRPCTPLDAENEGRRHSALSVAHPATRA